MVWLRETTLDLSPMVSQSTALPSTLHYTKQKVIVQREKRIMHGLLKDLFNAEISQKDTILPAWLFELRK